MDHKIKAARTRRQRAIRICLESLEERIYLNASGHHSLVLQPVHHAVRAAKVLPHHTVHQTLRKPTQHAAVRAHAPLVEIHRAPYPTSHLSLKGENDAGSIQINAQKSTLAFYPGITNTGSTPADDNLAVSGTEVVEAANEVLGFWSRSGSPVTYNGSNTIGLATLFPGAVLNSVWDPRIVFDPANGGHFILAALEESTSPQAAFADIAVSNDSNPSPNPSTWHLFRVNVATTVSGASCWLDFPGLGFDNQAIYLTGNLFSFVGGNYDGAKVMTFDKNALETSSTSGGTPGALTSANAEIISDGGSIQPVVTIGSAPAEYMIESWGATTVRLHAITNPLNSSYARTTTFVAVPGYYMSVPDAPQMGSTALIAANDTRILNAVWENGNLYAAHTIENLINGQNKATAQWYEIATGGWPSGTPSLSQWGNIDPGPGIATFFPSIAVDANGTIAIGYSESSSSMYASIFSTTITTSGAVATTLVHSGQAPYTAGRWGDYSGTVADPSIPGLFWTVGMSTTSTGAWGTWWSSNAQPADSIVVSAPTSDTPGQPFAFTLNVQLPAGGIDTAYTGTVQFTSSDPQAALPASYTFTAADAGVHTFTGTFSTVGTQWLTATDASNAFITGTQSGITVSTPAPSAFVVSGVASPDTAGSSQAFTVTAVFPNGSIDSGYTGTVHFTTSDGNAALPLDYTFATADAGSHTFRGCLKTAGNQWLKATDTITASLTGTESGITVTPAAASALSVLGYPSPVTAGGSHSFTVRVTDAFGNSVTGYRGTIAFSTSDGMATIPAKYTFTAGDAGIHTFTATFRTAGYQWISATDTSNASITGTQSNISVRKKH